MTSFSNFQLRNCINLNGKRVSCPVPCRRLLFVIQGWLVAGWSLKVREAHAQMPTNNCKTFTRTHATQSDKKLTQIRQKSKSNHTKIIEPIEYLSGGGMTLTPPGALAGHAPQSKQIQLESGSPSRNNHSSALKSSSGDKHQQEKQQIARIHADGRTCRQDQKPLTAASVCTEVCWNNYYICLTLPRKNAEW